MIVQPTVIFSLLLDSVSAYSPRFAPLGPSSRNYDNDNRLSVSDMAKPSNGGACSKDIEHLNTELCSDSFGRLSSHLGPSDDDGEIILFQIGDCDLR